MDKPKCRLCGERHYANEEHVFGAVTKPQGVSSPLSVTKPRNVTKSSVTVTEGSAACPECKRLRKALKEAQAEIDALHGEVAMLKRERAGGARGGRPPLGDKPMSMAERARRLRAKRKADSERMDFEG